LGLRQPAEAAIDGCTQGVRLDVVRSLLQAARQGPETFGPFFSCQAKLGQLKPGRPGKEVGVPERVFQLNLGLACIASPEFGQGEQVMRGFVRRVAPQGGQAVPPGIFVAGR